MIDNVHLLVSRNICGRWHEHESRTATESRKMIQMRLPSPSRILMRVLLNPTNHAGSSLISSIFILSCHL